MTSLRILAVIWLLLHFLALFSFWRTPVRLESNLTDLLFSDSSSAPLKFQLGKTFLAKSSQNLTFVAHAKSPEMSSQAAQLLKEKLRGRAELQILPSPEDLSVENLLAFFSRSRAYLLSPEQQAALARPNALAELEQSILRQLSNPMNEASLFLAHDPLLLLPDYLREVEKSLGSFGIAPASGHVIEVQVRGNVFDRNKQQFLVHTIEGLLAEVCLQVPQAEILWTGMLRFAESSATRMETEMKWLSSFASLAVALLLLFVFRSPWPLLLSVLSSCSGLLFGVLLSQLVFGSLHLLTFAFGASLMGACVDYALHFCCAHGGNTRQIGLETLRRTIPALGLGATTSALAFLALLFADFPGLRELSLFSMASLLASFLTVVLWLPFLTPQRLAQDQPIRQLSLKLYERLSRLPSSKLRLPLGALLLGLVLYGLSNVRSNDDIRLLQEALPELIANERRVRELSGSPLPDAYLFVGGENEQDLQNRLNEVSSLLTKEKAARNIHAFLSLGSLVPSVAVQQESFRAFKDFLSSNEEALRQMLQKLGYSEELIQRASPSESQLLREQQTLNMTQVLTSPRGRIFSPLSLGELNGKQWSVIPLFGLSDAERLESHLGKQSEVLLYRHANDISNLFGSYREQSLQLLLLAYLAIALVLCWRYGVRLGLRAFLPTLFITILTVACLGVIGQPLSFFSLLAIVIVLGLCIDYSVFFLEEERQTNGSVQLSVILSSLTTIIPFGALAFSETPMLRSFGTVIAVGVFFSMLLAQLPAKKLI